MLQSAKVTGTVIARVDVDHRGTVTTVTFDSTSQAHALFRASARKALRAIEFAPAKRFGIAHAGTLTYWVQYVLAETSSGGQSPQQLSGVDSVLGCPVARDETHLVVCGVPHVSPCGYTVIATIRQSIAATGGVRDGAFLAEY